MYKSPDRLTIPTIQLDVTDAYSLSDRSNSARSHSNQATERQLKFTHMECNSPDLASNDPYNLIQSPEKSKTQGGIGKYKLAPIQIKLQKPNVSSQNPSPKQTMLTLTQ